MTSCLCPSPHHADCITARYSRGDADWSCRCDCHKGEDAETLAAMKQASAAIQKRMEEAERLAKAEKILAKRKQ